VAFVQVYGQLLDINAWKGQNKITLIGLAASIF